MTLIERRVSSPIDAFDALDIFTDRRPDVLTWPMFGWGQGFLGVLRVDEYREDGAWLCGPRYLASTPTRTSR